MIDKEMDLEEQKRISHIASVRKYAANNTKYVGLQLNLTTDQDIIGYLEASGNKQGFIKNAIRQYIKQQDLPI